ncbi:cyclic nucleotide-binding protein [Actinomadura craniellae]|uniref:Cyclic nucleotide-binding protein n=1 Tax=Actinomadura craniellae TaxID=2231787 RepID=A0A365GW16_9ACTN|nr:FAD-dependent oxidoreductase [Actinomadura craniellae]RAY11009.1 cyclic nucleotide-binding protein [Actinomadura craniellae]
MEQRSLPETPDIGGAFPRLTEDQIELLATCGTRRRTRRDEVLFSLGEPCPDLFVILAGKAATLEDGKVVRVHGAGRFLGELNLFTSQRSFITIVVHEPGEVLVVPVERLRELLSRHTALGDLILRACIIRRSLLLGFGSGFRIIGSRFSPDSRRLREFAARNRLPHRWIELEEDPGAEELLHRAGVEPKQTPVVVWGESVLRNPDNAELARAIGLPAPEPDRTDVADMLVVGAGPAGLAASVYGASEGLATVLLDAVATGGQAGISPCIENYLGFPAGISGAELVERAIVQACKFGTEVGVPAEVSGLDKDDGYYLVRLRDGGTMVARSVIIATGARYRRLDVPHMAEYEGTCVFYAATAVEMAAARGVPTVVVGGGNSAGQAALSLAELAERVTLLVRGGDLSANMSRYLVDQIERSERVDVRLCAEVRELVADGGLNAIVVEDGRTGERDLLPARALFVFIGAVPHTGWLPDQVALDAEGFIRTGREAGPGPGGRRPGHLETSLPGVFAAGDVRSGSIKRVASAVGEGAAAVQLVHRRLAAGPEPAD